MFRSFRDESERRGLGTLARSVGHGYEAATVRYLIGLLLLASCRIGTPTGSPDAAGYPRCFASDPDGNPITCAAPERSYERDRCSCSDRYGRVYFGRVREHPEPRQAGP